MKSWVAPRRLPAAWVALFSGAWLLTACASISAPVAGFEADDARKVALIDGPDNRIRADMAWLADDAREGREAGAPGYDSAARYVAARMNDIGLQPGVAGQWFQEVPMLAIRRAETGARFSMATVGSAPVELTPLEDYLMGRPTASDRFSVAGPAVFAGYGIVDPRGTRDDYAGIDARGKIVVVFGGAPKAMNSEERAHFSSPAGKMRAAAAKGAIGVVTLRSREAAARAPWARAIANPASSSMTWVGPNGVAHSASPGLEASASLSEAGAEKLFAGEAKSYAALLDAVDADASLASFPLTKTLALEGGSTRVSSRSANVIGVIPGSDPKLRHEIVVLTAHLDHVGVQPPRPDSNGDGIHNGALDNASGVASMLETARALVTSGRPLRRTIVFAAVTAEEKGLIGADYLSRFPPFGRLLGPKARYVANINLDMPVLLYPFTDIVAYGAERSTLWSSVEMAAGEVGIALSPDPLPEQGLFTRSDHYRFVERGVPAVFLVPGFANGGEVAFRNFLATHYHRPSDDMNLPIDFDAAARFSDINTRIARMVADADKAPTWNEGDFFGDLFGKRK